MAIYAIIYDLVNRKTESDYQTLWDELRSLNAHRIQESFWLANINKTADMVLNHFKKFVHKDDKIFVTEIIKNRYIAANLRTGDVMWLVLNSPKSS